MLKDKLRRADLLLLLLYLTTAAIILFRISVEGTGYLSPDSKAYLGLAQNLKDAYGLYVPDAQGAGRHYFSIWPVGYPVMIYVFSELTTLDVYWASKILNLLLLGSGFLLLRQINRPYSFVLASVYGAYTFLEVHSFTWSEAPFLLLLLLLAYFANQVWGEEHINRNLVFIFFICLALFLVRYVGAFSFSVPALLGLYFGYLRKYKQASWFLGATLLLAILAGAYLYANYALSGFATGFDRLEAKTEAARSFVPMLLKGLMNEFLVIREYRPQNQPDYLLYATALLQLLVLVYIGINLKKYYSFGCETRKNSFSVTCLSIGLLYFVAILALRILSHFDDLDYRLLSPLSFMAFIGILHSFVSLPDMNKEIVRMKFLIFAFFVLSLLLNVPKKFVVSQLQLLF
ncbi:hypothetical protein [Pontibacter anaerobius]|uniref:Glycosyltransferase RgtA/B/C/D-like domain-containing protein n=1 Tax=Pontibacter anaerobius TaxID=2993940 RepID=A0ABT3RH31_9BACT|nr:hypothetical protein [Pontibacter anaerobius]MCX2740677.1 hypothetical protein [Pontibacter anaerobius]